MPWTKCDWTATEDDSRSPWAAGLRPWTPTVRQQRVKLIRRRDRESRQDVNQIRERVHVVGFARRDQAEVNRRSLATTITSHH